jgi:hypothetical protein
MYFKRRPKDFKKGRGDRTGKCCYHREGVAKAIEAKRVTVESILDDLARALTGAEGDKDWKGMVSAAIGQARVVGLMVEKHLVKAQHSIDVESLSDEELEERIADVQNRLRHADLESRERAGLDPATATLAEFWAAEDGEREEHAAQKARELNPTTPEHGYRPMVQTGRRVKLPKLLNGNGAQNASSVDLRPR